MNLVLHFRAPRAPAAGARGRGARRRARGRAPLRAARHPPRACRRGGRWPRCCSPARATRARAALAREELELAERWGTPLALARWPCAASASSPATSTARARRSSVLERLARPARAGPRPGGPRRRAAPRRPPRASARAAARWHGPGARLRRAPARRARPRPSCCATGARPRRLASPAADALTPSERRVATPGRRRADEPPDRAGAVRHDRDGRDPPAPRVPQARGRARATSCRRSLR